jgi:hypothetical protein
MDAATLAARVPVWTALSDMVLDTETRWYIPQVAFVLARSPYDDEQLTQIWRREAIAQFGNNLLVIAGEWGMLNVDERALIRHAESSAPRAGAVTRFILGGPLENEWQAILALVQSLRSMQEADRERYTNVWTAFAHGYIELNVSAVMFIESHVKTLRERGLAREQLLETFEVPFRRAYQTIVKGDEAIHTANVKTLIAKLSLW